MRRRHLRDRMDWSRRRRHIRSNFGNPWDAAIWAKVLEKNRIWDAGGRSGPSRRLTGRQLYHPVIGIVNRQIIQKKNRVPAILCAFF